MILIDMSDLFRILQKRDGKIQKPKDTERYQTTNYEFSGQLIEILQQKDKQIVTLETDLRDKQLEEDSHQERIKK